MKIMKQTFSLCLLLISIISITQITMAQSSSDEKASAVKKDNDRKSRTRAANSKRGGGRATSVKKDNTEAAETATEDSATKATIISGGDETEKSELEAALALPPDERIGKLKAFIKAHPRSALKTRAAELIVSARAALGDEKLKTGDAKGGMQQFQRAIEESPAHMSDKLFLEVVSQIPLNLFLRNERTAAREAARLIEAKVKDDPKRLLVIAGFYLNIEETDEVARLSELAIKLAPEMAAAHQALGEARRIALRLDEAAAEFARAFALDPKSVSARRGLADLRRATGKSDEALELYREQLKADPTDKLARVGVILSLFDTGKRDEAERELDAALKDEPRNLVLLVGAAYWYAAHNEPARAFEMAQKAVEIEPRYTWAHIALARALVGNKRPLDAERALRFARQYGQFPTLDYELASTLAAAGLYEEAAVELQRSFTIKDNQVETQLAGRTPARAASFIELLAPERRASIFQFTAADTEENARMLKGLLAFTAAIGSVTNPEKVKEEDALAGAQEFTAGEDAMRAYRQLYAASRLLQRGIGLQRVLELTEAATGGIEAALNVPVATVAVLADELRDIRTRAIAAGATPDVPTVPRIVLSNILRGRVEDLAGWALFNQDKAAEAVIRLRRATSVLPENTAWWRTATWHLGAALEASGNQQDALNAYLRSYNRNAPDPVRRGVIEALYRKVNGSLEGLDSRLGSTSALPSIAGDRVAATTPPTASETTTASGPAAMTSETPTTKNEAPATKVDIPAKSGETQVAQSEISPAKTETPTTNVTPDEVKSKSEMEAAAAQPPTLTNTLAAPSTAPAETTTPSSPAGDKVAAAKSAPLSPKVTPAVERNSSHSLEIEAQYDETRDVTTVMLPRMKVTDTGEPINIFAYALYEGAVRGVPEKVYLGFETSFREKRSAPDSLLLIVDGERLTLEPVAEEKSGTESDGNSSTSLWTVPLKFFDFMNIARARRVVINFGERQIDLQPEQIKAFRSMMFYLNGGGASRARREQRKTP